MLIPLTMVSAVVPSLLLIWFFHSRDVHREPARVVWTTFALGVLTVVPVLLVALPLSLVYAQIADPVGRGFAEAFTTAAMPEEFFKFLVIALYSARHREFDEPMDGVVYGATASLGFATLENVLYVAGGGTAAAVARAITAVPAHAFMGAIMGYYIGQAKFDPNRGGVHLAVAYAAPMVLHGLYDFPLLTLNHLTQGKPGLPTDDAALAGALLLLTLGALAVLCLWATRIVRRLRAEQHHALGAGPVAAPVRPGAPWPVAPPWTTGSSPGAAATPWGAEAPRPAAGWGSAPVAASTTRQPLAWFGVIAGGAMASLGGLTVLALVAAVMMGSEGTEDHVAVALGGVLIGVLPLMVGLLIFGLGLRLLAAARVPGRRIQPAR